jgi:phage gp46-like protein
MDIALVWDNANARADFVMSGSALLLGNDLESAVLISLFTDQVSDPADIMPPSEAVDPRGWWADTYETPDQIGSRLWQAFWRVRNNDTLNWARDTAARSLQWLIDDGAAAAIDVVPSFYGQGGLALQITVTEPSGQAFPFRFAWDQLAG